MPIAVLYRPRGMTLAQYEAFYRMLENYLQEQGLDVPEGALHLSLFGEDGNLSGFEIWETEEAYQEFASVLGSMVAEVGIEVPAPEIVPIQRLAQAEARVEWLWPR